MALILGCLAGAVVWFVIRCILGGFYTIEQNERAVKTVFGRVERIEGVTSLDDPLSDSLNEDEKERYVWPQVRVIPPGGPYFKFPWEQIYKVSVATETINLAYDPDTPTANNGGTVLEAVTKDQLNTGLSGQIRFTVCERNLYPYIFGVKQPLSHIMGYLVSVLRERIANFEPKSDPNSSIGDDDNGATKVIGISINDLRKNLRDINEHMEKEAVSSAARYGIILNAALITSIDPPPDVDAALAAINTAHNHVASEISLAQANADQLNVQSKRAVEIETLKAQAEVEPLNWLSTQLKELKKQGPDALPAYLRNIRLALYGKANRIVMEMKK